MVGVSTEPATESVDTPDDEQPDGVGEPSYAPPYVASGFAIGGALVVIATVGAASFTAALTAALGTWVVGAGLSRGGERIATGGAALLFGGILVAGLEGAPELLLLVAAVGTAIAFDGSRYAVRLGYQIGREAPTASAEIAHISVIAVTTVVTAGVGYLVFLIGAGEQTTTTLVALLVATLLLISGLYIREN